MVTQLPDLYTKEEPIDIGNVGCSLVDKVRKPAVLRPVPVLARGEAFLPGERPSSEFGVCVRLDVRRMLLGV